MKLNLDFSLYKGTTRLRHWWKAVKANFETVQKAHNDLEEKHAEDMETLKKADADLIQRIENEVEIRESADRTLGERITNEATARSNADTSLGRRIDDEETARETADDSLRDSISQEERARIDGDTKLGTRIDGETAARENLDARFKPVAEMAHTHENKDVLDEITRERAMKWDTLADGTVTLGEYLEHLAETERQFGMLWGLLGMNVYDGGWFGMAQIDTPLDGGSFEDTGFTPLDCGGFEPYVIPSGGVGELVDGGSY